jgi:hypothetical protein
MYDIMYSLFPSFPGALVSYKGRENFLMKSLLSLRFSEQPDCIDYFNILS